MWLGRERPGIEALVLHKPPYNNLPPNQMWNSRDTALYIHSLSPSVQMKWMLSVCFYCSVTEDDLKCIILLDS